MKILHLLYSNKYSGAENVVCQIIEMFKVLPEVEMIYCSRDGEIRKILKEKGVRFISLKDFSIRTIKQVIVSEKPDLVHAHDFIASVVGAISCGNIPVISHLHNNAPWMKSYGIPAAIYKIISMKFAGVFAVSDSVFDEYVFGKRMKKEVTVIGNPVNCNEIREKAKLISVEGNYDIVFCGRLTQQKNPLFIVDIIGEVQKQIPEIKAILIGEGELKENVEEKIVELGLENNVALLGFVTNPYPYIKNSKVMLFPSLWEGYGLVAVESIALGVPVVCSGVGGLSGIVNEKCGGIFKTKEEYVEEIVRLLRDQIYLEHKKCNCIVRAKELDNIEKYREVLMEKYKYYVRK